MYINLEREGTVKGLQRLLEQTAADEQTSGILVLACEENDFTPGEVDEFLIQCKKPIFGGVFPQILFNREKLRKGTIVAGINQPVSTRAIKNVNNHADLDAVLENTFEWETLKNKTMFVFVDWRSKNLSALVESIFNCCGLFPNYIGGGAGSLNGKKPCVFSNEGLLQDAVVLALTGIKSGIGVAHGWEPVAGPLRVTAVEDNAIISLNWRPALEVYQETVERISGKSFEKVGFSRLARGFPFGIIKMAEEMVVRDPVILGGKKLSCVGGIPLNSFIYILGGDRDTVISGAAMARQKASVSYLQAVNREKEKLPVIFFMDCYSRVLFLQSDFYQELTVASRGYPLLGALTLGEIANTGRSYLEFYNYTAVIGLLED